MYVLFFRLNVDLKALFLCGQVRVRDDENFNFKFFCFLFLKDFKNKIEKLFFYSRKKKKQKFNSKVKKKFLFSFKYKTERGENCSFVLPQIQLRLAW